MFGHFFHRAKIINFASEGVKDIITNFVVIGPEKERPVYVLTQNLVNKIKI